MKTQRILIILFLVIAVVGSSCDELLADLLKFNTQWYTVDFTIKPSDEVGYVEFKTEEFDADLDSLLNANNISKDNISSAKLSDAKVTILTEGCDFDPVDNVELFIATPNLGSKKIATVDSISDGAVMVELDLIDEDLQEYLLETKFTASIKGTLNSKVEKIVDLQAEIRWIIRGKLTN